MTASILAVIHETAGTGKHAIRVLQERAGDRNHLLVLPGAGPGRSLATQFTRALPTQLTEIDVRPYLEQVSVAVREELIRFTAEWPDRDLPGGSFKARFRHENLSLWWLTALSEKNNEDRPTFNLLCDLELIRRVLDNAATVPDQALIVTHSSDFYAVCRRLLTARGIRVLGVRPRRLFDSEGIPVLLARRIRRFVSWSARVVAARWLSRGRRETPSAPPVAFYTWYPSQWVRPGGVSLDRYYVDLPNYLRTHCGIPVTYAASGQGIRLRQHLQALREVGHGSTESAHVEFLERYLRLRDVVKVYWGSLAPLRYLWLELASRTFRRSFGWRGVNCFEILRRDLRISFVERVPDHLLFARQMERFVKTRRPPVLVTYLELYCHGRAIISGAKQGHPDVVTVGYQHSAITRNKLFYRFEPHELAKAGDDHPDFVAHMPTPDRFAVTGPIGARVLAAGGYPTERLWTIGSPRFDGLRESTRGTGDAAARRSELGIEAGRVVVLITGNIFLDGTRHLIEQSLLALRARPDCFALFKLHPFNQTDATAWIRRLAERQGGGSYAVTDLDVHSLLGLSDVLISTNSTTTAEGIAAGLPVINLRTGYLDLSPVVEGDDVAWEARDHEEIAAALDEIASQSGRFDRIMSNRRDAFVEGVFGRLDGAARERFAARICLEFGAGCV